MTENIILEYDAFIRSVKQNKDVSHAFLLGAGASLSSGIQSAADCIWEWKRDIYTSQNINSNILFNNYKSDTVRKSIQNWLDKEGIYPKEDAPEEYTFYAEKAYPIPDDRRKYFQKLSEGKEPFIGYKLLCLLNDAEIVKSVWSTNFDGLVERASHKMNLTPIAVNLDNEDRIFRNESRNELLYVALHGDYKYSTLKNTNKELDSQSDVFTSTLIRYFNDKNLIVSGYSGRDKSLMDTLKATFSERGSGRLYWCGYGHEPNSSVRELIEVARLNGREAFYIPTEGFDKTIKSICRACFETEPEKQQRVDDILKSADVKTVTTPFTLNSTRNDKYIKSNMHPISFPKEVFQFEIDYPEGVTQWNTIKTLIGNLDIVAVPFKGKIFAISTLTNLNTAFGSKIKTEIVRVPISKQDIRKVSAFQNLVLNAITNSIAKKSNLDTDGRLRIWNKTEKYNTKINDYKIGVHEALKVSLFFDKGFSYLVFNPSVYLVSDNELSKEIKQSISKPYLEKLFNNKYDEYLENWNTVIFGGNKLVFDYPINSGNDLKFIISNNSSYSSIQVLDENFRAYQPNDFNQKLVLHKGVQYLEPQLLFTNKFDDRQSKDFHPMRGLVTHRPYDYLFNGKVFSNEVKIGIICPEKYSQVFSTFLNGLQQQSKADKNVDYLIDYPGFLSAYNIPIDIPTTDSDRWSDNKFTHTSDSIKANAISLARSITSKIQQLSDNFTQISVAIFIPKEWEAYQSYDEEGEKFDLHDYIKAFAAQKNVATQLIQEKTLTEELKCQKYWWLSLSFYVKSLRTPWILSNTDTTTAFAGIGYSIKKQKNKTEVVLGCSHIYDSQGQGLKYKLSKVEDFVLDKKSNPFLSYEDAFQFGVSIRELFMQSMNTLPQRVVVHKRTPFKKDEIQGITDSLFKAGIEKIDLIEINHEQDVKYFATKVYNNSLQIDGFPISRGTCIVTDETTALLWTHGIVPSVKNPNYKFYLGGRSIPSPLKIIKHYGESDINTIATEILGLTKMNWNSFDLYTKLPATISSSNEIARIGNLLSRFEGRMYDYRFFI